MTRTLPLLLLCAFAASACAAAGDDAILDGIAKSYRAEVHRAPAEIWSWQYQGAKVYYVPPACCDIYGNLYDANGTLMCHPDGGIIGRGDGKCADFRKLRSDGKLLRSAPAESLPPQGRRGDGRR